MPPLALPEDVHAVLRETRAEELSTMARDGTPITWPVSVQYLPDEGRFRLTTSISLPTKAFNIRRDPRIAILYSDPRGSGLVRPPAVLVQGEAVAPDQVVTSVDGLEEYWREVIYRRQPSSAFMGKWPLRGLFWWYYARIVITVTPRRIRWWPDGDFAQAPQAWDAGSEPAATGGRAAQGAPEAEAGAIPDAEWSKIASWLPRFEGAVLSACDGDGLPCSVRCRPALDETRRALRVPPEGGPLLAPGPANLMCHWHDGKLWGLKSFLVRGRLARDGEGWLFQPRKLVPGAGMTGLLKELLQFMREGPRTARRYLAERKLPMPSIPWADLDRLRAESRVEAPPRRPT